MQFLRILAGIDIKKYDYYLNCYSSFEENDKKGQKSKA